MHVDHDHGRAAFLDALGVLVDVASTLDDDALLAASRCRGWTTGDVLVHVHLGLQEMLLGVVSPTDAEPDTDAVSYWRTTVPGTDPDAEAVSGVRFVRLLGAAYRRPTGVVGHLRPTVAGLTKAVTAMPAGAVEFQGHVLATGSFLATWAVELAVHHLDLRVAHGPAPAALRLARTTVEALAGGPLPSSWSDESAVLVGAGREPVPGVGAGAGAGGWAVAARLPVLG